MNYVRLYAGFSSFILQLTSEVALQHEVQTKSKLLKLTKSTMEMIKFGKPKAKRFATYYAEYIRGIDTVDENTKKGEFCGPLVPLIMGMGE